MIVDDALREWEAYASAGPHGLPGVGRIVFRCRSDSGVRPRYRDLEGDRAGAEALLVQATPDELRALLKEAVPVT